MSPGEVAVIAVLCGLGAGGVYLLKRATLRRFRAKFDGDPDVIALEARRRWLITRPPHREGSAVEPNAGDRGYFWDIRTHTPKFAARTTFQVRRKRPRLLSSEDSVEDGGTRLGNPDFDLPYRLDVGQHAAIAELFENPDLQRSLVELCDQFRIWELRLREGGELFCRIEQKSFTDDEMKEALLAVVHFAGVMELIAGRAAQT